MLRVKGSTESNQVVRDSIVRNHAQSLRLYSEQPCSESEALQVSNRAQSWRLDSEQPCSESQSLQRAICSESEALQ